ncbi:MAG: MFS transporter [Kiritimatiellaeota bacterium]|nr:MFS transporter [Kiritimatiellota bacterium]
MNENTTAKADGAMTNYRWTICALLFFATTINYIDRQILSLIQENLYHDYGWNDAHFGIINMLFQGAYGIGLLWFGWYVDRKGVRAGYTLSMIGWSLAAMAHALVKLLPVGSTLHIGGTMVEFTTLTVGAFGFCRVLLGLAEAGNFPAAIKGVAQWFPKRERAYATSIFNAGTNVGAIVAPAVVPFLANQFGGPSPFLLAGVAGFLWLFFWIPMYKTPETHPRCNKAEHDHILSDNEAVTSAKVKWLGLLKHRQTWSFITAKFMTDPVWWFFLIWLPGYFKDERQLDIKHSWVHLVTIYVVVTVLSIFGGWITGHLNKLGWSVSRARKTGMFVFALCVLPILGVRAVGDWAAVLIIGLAGAAHQAWSANLYTTVSDMFPKKAVASIIGIGGMAGSAGGMIFPLLTGVLLRHYKLLGHSDTAYAILFTICGCAYLVSFTIHHLLAPRFEPIQLDEK